MSRQGKSQSSRVHASRTNSQRASKRDVGEGHQWNFLSNHGHVILCLAEEPEIRLRDVAERVGITERSVHNIVTDLEAAGIITRHRQGRRNHYDVDLDQPLRHPLEAHCTVRELLDHILVSN